jgi:hypothetical protein
MPLPTFLICGAKKAGTTALAQYLSAHPNVIMSRPKETGFFCDNFSRGTDWLETHFQHHDGETAVGEGSVHTMYCPKSPKRIHETIPDARLIFLLRNPIERLYSHYYYDLRCGHLDPSTSFQDVIYRRETSRHKRMVRMGFYEEQLSRFDERFDDQMLILLTDDLRERTQEVVRNALSFIGVDPSRAQSEHEPKNKTRHIQYRRVYAAVRTCWKPVQSLVESALPTVTERIRSMARSVLSQDERPPMPVEDRRYLREVYAGTIQRVERRLGRDLSGWG